MIKRIKESQEAITQAVKILSKGGLIFTATETVYIAVVDATNAKAVKKLVAFKNRPFGKPFSVGVTDIKMAKKYVDINETAEKLYNQFLPGPVTIVSKGKHTVAPGVESETGTLGIRIPDYIFFLDLVKKYGKPLTTTSANASYQRRPYKLSHILDNISEKQKNLIDLMIDAGTLPTREPSTVIDTTLDDPAVLRQGDIKFKDNNEVLSRSEENTQNIAKELWQKYESFAGKRAIIFALTGKMGAGKTVFVKGLARAMGIKESVTSPTYDLLNHYTPSTTRLPLIHIDTWRMIDAAKEMKDLRTEELITDKSVIAIEWADKIERYIRSFSEDALIIWVKIVNPPAGGENERLIRWGAL